MRIKIFTAFLRRFRAKSRSLVAKRLDPEKYICETYVVIDAKTWAKEQVRLMNKAEKDDAAKFNME